MRVVLAMLLLLGCGSSLARHASSIPIVDERSVLDDAARAALEASLGPEPTEARVRARWALLVARPARLTSAEGRALLESHLAWIERLVSGWTPAWSFGPAPFPGRGDVAGSLVPPTPYETLVSILHGTRWLLEDAAVPAVLRAWRAAMRELHPSDHECADEGHEGAIAAALGIEWDTSPTRFTREGRDRSVRHATLSCHVATLGGAVRLAPTADSELEARSCTARGAGDERCTFGGAGSELATRWDAVLARVPDDEVVVVTLARGSIELATVVVHREGVWRVLSHEVVAP